jgi:hypothetical protein
MRLWITDLELICFELLGQNECIWCVTWITILGDQGDNAVN